MKRTGQRVFEILCVFASCLFVVGCDAVYYVRLSAQLPLEVDGDPAAELERGVREKLGLECRPTTHALLHDALEAPPWRLLQCEAGSTYARLLIASSPRELAIEVHQIGGLREPETFKSYRLGAYDLLGQVVPDTPILVDTTGSIPRKSFD